MVGLVVKINELMVVMMMMVMVTGSWKVGRKRYKCEWTCNNVRAFYRK